MKIITVERKILKKNDEIAAENRKTFERHRIFALNLVSSPGSGKTRILERTIEALRGMRRIGVVEGDVQTDRDARRISRHDVPVVQIVTQGACHLEAALVQDAMSRISLDDLDVLVIENVGNLVCPASFDLGERHKVVIASTTEGDDKPAKYPKMFHVSDVCIINKTDLLPYVDFDLDRFKSAARDVNPSLTFFEMSAKTGQGVEAWVSWLKERSAR